MITVQSNINTSIETVWECWTTPKHIIKWNNASDDWHTPYAENDLRVGGKFKSTMAAKDGSMSLILRENILWLKKIKLLNMYWQMVEKSK